jgi:hypothetical protein
LANPRPLRLVFHGEKSGFEKPTRRRFTRTPQADHHDHHPFQWVGLVFPKMIAQKTGQQEFAIDADAVESSDKVLSDWVVKSYRPQ